MPDGIKYCGRIVDGVQWADAIGEHILLITETGEKPGLANQDSHEAELYAYHYTTQGDACLLTWKLYDCINHCPPETRPDFIRSSFALTDLDKNNIAEVWLMYSTACRGDVSATDMKLVVYEGERKYTMRGRNKVKVPETETESHGFVFDEKFQNAPETFRRYAVKLWKRSIFETGE